MMMIAFLFLLLNCTLYLLNTIVHLYHFDTQNRECAQMQIVFICRKDTKQRVQIELGSYYGGGRGLYS